MGWSGSLRCIAKVKQSSLSPTCRWVLVAIATDASNQTGEAYPHIQTVARETGFGVRAVRDAIRDLEHFGWLVPLEGRTGRNAKRWQVDHDPADVTGAEPAPSAARKAARAAGLEPAPPSIKPAPPSIKPAPPAGPPHTTEGSRRDPGGSARDARDSPAHHNGHGSNGLFGDAVPTVGAAIEEQVTQALAVWGEEVNRQIGKRAATPAIYTKSRKWVRAAIVEHGLETVLESFRYLAHHPDNDNLRRKAQSKGGAPFLKLRWWLDQGVAEHAHNNRGRDGHTSSRSLDQAEHESGGREIPL